MSIKRIFLDWSQPALLQATEHLVDRFAHGDHLNLEGVVIVVPGSRAGGRLLEILVNSALQDSRLFFPPRIETMGSLPELLYESKRPFATDLVQKLTWVQALKSQNRERTVRFIPQLPADDNFSNWMDLGEMLWRQHRELAGDGYDFDDIVKLGSSVVGSQEVNRWMFWRQVQRKYLSILDGLGLWDMQTARLFAIEHRLCRSDNEIVLLATADMNRAMRLMLDQLPDRVTALVHAPDSIADRFDEHGCIAVDAWQDVSLDLRDNQIKIAENPPGQADAALRSIANFDDRYRADEIVIGVPDETLIPHIQRQLLLNKVESRWAIGKTLPETTPFRLLDTIARYVESQRTSDFASLVRHPDVYDFVRRQGVEETWLPQLDEYCAKHLQPRFGEWLGSQALSRQVRSVEQLLQKTIQPLRESPRPLNEWATVIARVLSQVYGESELDVEDPAQYYAAEALKTIRSVLLEHQSMPTEVAPQVESTQAVHLVLEQLKIEQIATPHKHDSIELLGWLELPLDLAKGMIVTSFNEGFIPKSQNSDLFLPDALRQKLCIVDNAHRYARDAYALSVLLALRKDLVLVTGRNDAEGNPLVPSRLAFAADPETVAERARAFFQEQDGRHSSRPLIGQATPLPKSSDFIVRKPEPLAEPVQSISVTAFRSYLACPYRFYLQHVLKLVRISDAAEELDAPTFGNAIHAVLQRFGEDDIRDSTDEEEIRHFLQRTADNYFKQTYGSRRLPAVDIQSRQMRTRLNAFASWQAARARHGWKICFTETSGGDEPVLLHTIDGQSMTLRGRIDRIDHNEATDEWAVLDYKTGDSAKPPEKTHRNRGQWIDLQLPLYRQFLPALGVEGQVGLGYIVLPKDTTKVGALLAEWSDDELNQADELAVEIAESVINQEFWPPKYPPPNIMTDFSVICQEQVFERRIEQ